MIDKKAAKQDNISNFIDLFKGYDWEESQDAKSQRADGWWKSVRSPGRVNHP